MKYFKVFENESEYNSFIKTSDYVLPNVSVFRDSGDVILNPYILPPTLAAAGDVAYWDGSSVKTTPLSSWNTSLGTPVGVVVVPEGFAPDGKTRIVSLKSVDTIGNQVDLHVKMMWGGYGTDTSLTNYTKVPTTDNIGSTSTGSSSSGYLPSDKFTGTTSYVDSKVKYSTTNTSDMIPSPYLGESPNPEYYKTISGNNVFSDFNGLSNTQTLVNWGTDYTAANVAYKYNDGVSNLQWYLPGMGELGYILPRFNVINNTLTTLGGLTIDGDNYFWSSSEFSDILAFRLRTDDGYVRSMSKDFSFSYVRPFAILDNNGGGVTMISFTVGGVQYQAEEGMTWGEFVNSEYNNGDIFVSNGVVGTNSGYIQKDYNCVLLTDIIENNYTYIVRMSGSAN
jgi:hypothetical protein